MMLEAGYQEPLFVREGHSMTKEMQESIPALLRANHGVGIIGGGYEPGLPICFISELQSGCSGTILRRNLKRQREIPCPHCFTRISFPRSGFARLQMRRKRICAQKTARFGCDIMMPVMDGYAATGAIRTMDRPDAKEVQIVAMTANAFAEDMKKCRDAGMNAHLAKPFKVEQLISSIADRGWCRKTIHSKKGRKWTCRNQMP